MLGLLVNQLLFRPIFNLLMLLVALLGGSMGWSIILLTLIIRGAMYKNSAKALAMQKNMGGNNADLPKKMQEVQEKYADDPQRQAKEMMKMMKGSGGPLKGCLSLVLQLPVFLGLYGVISSFANYGHEVVKKPLLSFDIPFNEQIYSFFHNLVGNNYLDMSAVNHMFMGTDLLASHNIVIAIVTGVLMVLQMYMTSSLRPVSTKKQTLPGGAQMPDMQKMMKPMMIFMAVMMAGFAYSTVAGIGLYLVTTTFFGLGQALYANRMLLKAKRQAKRRGKHEGEVIEG